MYMWLQWKTPLFAAFNRHSSQRLIIIRVDKTDKLFFNFSLHLHFSIRRHSVLLSAAVIDAVILVDIKFSSQIAAVPSMQERHCTTCSNATVSLPFLQSVHCGLSSRLVVFLCTFFHILHLHCINLECIFSNIFCNVCAFPSAHFAGCHTAQLEHGPQALRSFGAAAALTVVLLCT